MSKRVAGTGMRQVVESTALSIIEAYSSSGHVWLVDGSLGDEEWAAEADRVCSMARRLACAFYGVPVPAKPAGRAGGSEGPEGASEAE